MLRPRERKKHFASIVASAILVLGLALTMFSVFENQLMGVNTFDSGASLIIGGLLYILFIIESKRLESVALDEQGVSAFVWSMAPFPSLRKVSLGWKDVKKIGQRGNVFLLDCGDFMITVNPNIFDQPQAVINFLMNKVQ